MSYEYSAIRNRQQKHPKVHFRQYLSNPGEPRDNIFNDTPAELETELLENNRFSRRHFRHIAQSIRNRYT